MKYRDLREFCVGLEAAGELRRVAEPLSARLEMTALSDRVLRAGGPALWFERPLDSGGRYKIPALTNLFGTTKRVAMGMGAADVGELRDIGRVLASLKEPEPPKGLKDTGRLLHLVKSLWDMKPADRAPGGLSAGDRGQAQRSICWACCRCRPVGRAMWGR